MSTLRPGPSVRSPTINVMERAVRKAARGLVRDFGEIEQLQVSVKGPADFVSTADLRAEETLKAELAKARPGYGYLMEESGQSASGDGHHRWLVDPLDGTTNFLHGIPHFCISVALERDQEIVAGIVYDPLRDEMFWAERGLGAFVNERRLRVSGRRGLADAVIGTGIPFRERGQHEDYLARLARVMATTAGVRRMGAAALDLAYVAAGRFDGFFEYGLSPWDMAAGMILVREAGGYVSEIDGGKRIFENGNILAANDHLHLHLGRVLREPERKPARAPAE